MQAAKFTLDDEEDDLETRSDSDGTFAQRLQSALALSISTDLTDVQQFAANSQAGVASGSGDGVPNAGSVITPNSAAAAAFDSALITPGHSRGGSVIFGGVFSGSAASDADKRDSDRQLHRWHSPPPTSLSRAVPASAGGGLSAPPEDDVLPPSKSQAQSPDCETAASSLPSHQGQTPLLCLLTTRNAQSSHDPFSHSRTAPFFLTPQIWNSMLSVYMFALQHQ